MFENDVKKPTRHLLALLTFLVLFVLACGEERDQDFYIGLEPIGQAEQDLELEGSLSDYESIQSVLTGKTTLRRRPWAKSGVGLLQDALVELGYMNDPGRWRGYFGPKTKRAVIAFQRDFALGIDGVVGQNTMTELDRALESFRSCSAQRLIDALETETIEDFCDDFDTLSEPLNKRNFALEALHDLLAQLDIGKLRNEAIRRSSTISGLKDLDNKLLALPSYNGASEAIAELELNTGLSTEQIETLREIAAILGRTNYLLQLDRFRLHDIGLLMSAGFVLDRSSDMENVIDSVADDVDAQDHFQFGISLIEASLYSLGFDVPATDFVNGEWSSGDTRAAHDFNNGNQTQLDFEFLRALDTASATQLAELYVERDENDAYEDTSVIVTTVGSTTTLYVMHEGQNIAARYKVTPGSDEDPTEVGDFLIQDSRVRGWWVPPNSDWASERVPEPAGLWNPMGLVKHRLYGSVFIHGTIKTAEWALGIRRSHGCIRMSPANILHATEKYLRPGIPVTIVDDAEVAAELKQQAEEFPLPFLDLDLGREWVAPYLAGEMGESQIWSGSNIRPYDFYSDLEPWLRRWRETGERD